MHQSQHAVVYQRYTVTDMMCQPAANAACTVYAGPAAYRTPGCKGSTTPGKVACAPSAAAISHWADFASLLTSRWSGAKGRFTHYIIWNEVPKYQSRHSGTMLQCRPHLHMCAWMTHLLDGQ